MSAKTETTTIYTCDACGCTSPTQRPRAYCAWARLRWEQDAGFDSHGAAWCNRVQGGHIDLCPDCADAVMAVIERKREGRPA